MAAPGALLSGSAQWETDWHTSYFQASFILQLVCIASMILNFSGCRQMWERNKKLTMAKYNKIFRYPKMIFSFTSSWFSNHNQNGWIILTLLYFNEKRKLGFLLYYFKVFAILNNKNLVCIYFLCSYRKG